MCNKIVGAVCDLPSNQQKKNVLNKKSSFVNKISCRILFSFLHSISFMEVQCHASHEHLLKNNFCHFVSQYNIQWLTIAIVFELI